MRLIFFCSILFLAFPHFVFSQQTVIDLKTDNLPLSEVISQLEKKYNYLFSFKEADIKNITITQNATQAEINDFLKTILYNTGLEHEIINGHYIIIKKIIIPANDLSKIKNDNELNLPVLCGTVVDSLTRKPLPYASVYFKKTDNGSYAGENGGFKFKGNFSEKDTVAVSYVGYAEKYFPAHYFKKKNCPEIALSYFNFSNDFIVVTDYLTDGIDLGDNGAATVIRPDRIGALPGQAEPDIFKTIQFLPGISSPNGESSNMYVRGGAADQNLILWEGIPIYHASHYFGMVSAFNPYIIDKIKVYRGGFGAEYGGRASSVIDMHSADYDLKKSEFGAGVNFINAYTYGKISTPNNSTSIVYSLRRSLSELWRSPTFDNITQRNQQSIIGGNIDLNRPGIRLVDGFYFLDSHVKAAARISPKDKLAASFFYGKNDFNNDLVDQQKREKQIDLLDLKSNGFSISWERDWSELFSSKILGVNTLYNYDYSYEIDDFDVNPVINKFGNKYNRVNERQVHFSNVYKINSSHTIKAGYQYTNYDVSHQILHESNMDTLASDEADIQSGVHAVYTEFNSSQNNKLGIDAGFRVSHFEILKKNYFSPRLRLWYNMSDALSWQANVGRYYQFASQLVEFRGDFLGIDTPIWVLADDKEVPITEATQFQLGFIYNKNAWVVDVQAYIKEINGLSSFSTGFNVLPGQFEPGSSSAKGMDILIKKRWNKFRMWASYTLSKTTYQFPRFLDNEFPANFDQRHIFNWANQWTHKQFEFSLGYHIASGVPYSVFEKFKIENTPQGNQRTIPMYEAYNDHNLPLQHHLDASVLYKFGSENNSKFKGVVGLSFFNIYNQENIYSREYFLRKTPDMDYEIDVNDSVGLGFTPNAVVRFEW